MMSEYREATCDTDHHFLKSTIMFPRRNEKRKEKQEDRLETSNPLRYNLDSLEQESVKMLYKKRLDEKITNIEFNNTERHYSYIKEYIHAVVKEAIGYYEGKKQQKPYWWDEEIRIAIEEKRKKPAVPNKQNKQR